MQQLLFVFFSIAIVATLFPTLIVGQLQFIKQFAGNGTAGYQGDNGLASSSKLNNPFSAFIDSVGNMYIADTDNNRIRKVSAGTNIITTIAGTGASRLDGDGGSATAAILNGPRGVWVSTTGTVYIVDTGNHRIRWISTTGIINTFAGMNVRGYLNSMTATVNNITATASTMGSAFGLVADTNGNIYFSENTNHRIRKISSSGIVSKYAGTGTAGYNNGHEGVAATSAFLYGPRGLAIDSNGNLYIADTNNNRIRKVMSTTAKIYTVVSIPSTTCSFLFVDNLGQVYFTDESNLKVKVFSGVLLQQLPAMVLLAVILVLQPNRCLQYLRR